MLQHPYQSKKELDPENMCRQGVKIRRAWLYSQDAKTMG